MMGVHNLARTSDERRTAIRSLLIRGASIKSIARQLKCSPHTIVTVREMDAEPIVDEQRVLARKAHLVAQQAFEQVSERLANGEEVGLKELTIIAAVATDKTLVLSGAPTARVEHIKGESPREWLEALKAAANAAQMKAAAVDVGPERGTAEPEAGKGQGRSGKGTALEAGGPERQATGGAGAVVRGRGRGGSAKLPPHNTHKDPTTEKNFINEPNQADS
jgi:transposase-like protein